MRWALVFFMLPPATRQRNRGFSFPQSDHCHGGKWNLKLHPEMGKELTDSE